jgi:hypothetical protein
MRLEVIRAFDEMTPTAKERVIQSYLFRNLWLLHPSWERPTSNTRMEESVAREWDQLRVSEEERRGRLDIRYATAAGKHIIVELKKADVTVTAPQLVEQLSKYRNALRELLRQRDNEFAPHIECVALLGTMPTGMPPEESDRVLAAINARALTYDTLIDEALASYQDYLDASRRVSLGFRSS